MVLSSVLHFEVCTEKERAAGSKSTVVRESMLGTSCTSPLPALHISDTHPGLLRVVHAVIVITGIQLLYLVRHILPVEMMKRCEASYERYWRLIPRNKFEICLANTENRKSHTLCVHRDAGRAGHSSLPRWRDSDETNPAVGASRVHRGGERGVGGGC